MKKLLTIPALALFLISAGAEQIDGQTGNIVYTTLNPAPAAAQGAHTWSGFTVSNTSGGGFSGGNIPAYNPNTGTFIFGYTQRTVNYGITISAINFALANNGSNVQINGFKYSWQYYNQDVSRGTLMGNINLTNSSGQSIQSFNYNMPQTSTGWTLMSGTQNFNTNYSMSSLGRLEVNFTGKDDRFWAGYYGPQIRDIDVKMLYSVSATNTTPSPAPSPSPISLPVTTVNNTTTATINEITTTTEQPIVMASPTTTDTSTSNNVVSSSALIASTPTTTSQTTSSTNNATTTSTASTVASSTPSSSSSRTVDGTSIGLSVVSRNAQREQSIAMQASQNAIAAAEQTAQQSQQEAVNVAQSSSTNSVSFSSNPAAKQFQSVLKNEQSQQTITNQTQNSLSISSFQSNTQQAKTIESKNTLFSLLPEQAPVVATQSMPAITQINNLIVSQPVVATPIISAEQPATTQVATSLSLLPPVPTQQIQSSIVPFVAQEIKENNQNVSITTQSQTVFSNIDLQITDKEKLLTDKTNPINQINESKPEIQSSSSVQQKTTVNTNASDSEIAGGVSLAKISITPAGYNQYLNLVISDASFYAPKEIYRGQRNVDNVRALRQMSSDKLHQEMVNQQYRRN